MNKNMIKIKKLKPGQVVKIGPGQMNRGIKNLSETVLYMSFDPPRPTEKGK